MAISIMGGLVSATALTLLFVPALYAAWHRLPRGQAARKPIGLTGMHGSVAGHTGIAKLPAGTLSS
ncbi:MAG: efflux RND transporter permease subunit [Gemmatimonadaceae bacterium]|nr:efflux RND transporter permease subunit [Acetobacteraceae bacterium]